MRRALRSAGAVLLIAAAFAIGWVRLPLYALGPGPPREIVPMIHVEDATTYGSSGHFVMTTVRFTQVTSLGALLAWLDPDRLVVGEDVLYPGGLTPDEETQRAISQMDQSKIDAAAVVLPEVSDYPREHGPGALVEFVGSDCPADDQLFPGDRIVRIEGQRVDSQVEASRLLDGVPTDEPIDFRIDTDGQMHDVRLTRGR
jgi:Lon-like protease